MNSEIKLPTLLALLILLTGIIIGVYSISHTTSLSSKAAESSIPEKVEIDNITDTSASIAWLTPSSVSSFVTFGTTPGLGDVAQDDRDQPNLLPHTVHLVTLNNLIPGTTYFLKINSGNISYPDQPLSFITSSVTTSSSYQPLIGSVIDNNMKVVSEALIKLEIPGAQVLTTATHGNGGFILPLSQIKNKDLTSSFIIQPNTQATLTVFNLTDSSQITLLLPYPDKLPAITLGKDMDLQPTPSPTPQPVLGISKIVLNPANFDFNNDKKVDYKDLSILLKNIGKQPVNLKFDLNGDNKVDYQDVAIFEQGLKQINP